jgi:hypothetical protein
MDFAMNNLRIKWKERFCDVYGPEDGDGDNDYSWYVYRSTLYPSEQKWVDHWRFAAPTPVDIDNREELKEWLEMAYVLGLLPEGTERNLP